MSLGAAFILATTVALANEQGVPPQPQEDTGRRGPVISDRVRDDWMLSVEGVTRIPIEAGVQGTFEMPFGLRLFGGYGWVPPAYIGLIVNAAAGSRYANLALALAEYSGNSARFGVGYRPFRSFGAYFDASYAHVRLDAVQPIPAFSVPGYSFPGGTYALHSGMDLWTVELGYQLELERRVVLAAALGLTGAMQSHTLIRAEGGAPSDEHVFSQASGDVDHILKSNVLPVFTLRLGFDLI